MRHLNSAFAYVAANNLPAAKRPDVTIVRATEQLGDFPMMGHAGPIEGTCELVIQTIPDVAVYRLVGGSVCILALLHGARRWLTSF